MTPTTPGWVYVLASTSRPGVVKIGRSTRSAEARVRELDRAEDYAAFGPFREVWSRAVPDCCGVEAAAHRMLAHKRVRVGRSPCRELFDVDVAEACRVVAAAADAARGRARQSPAWRSASPRRRPFMPRGRRCGLRTTARAMFGTAAMAAALWALLGGHLLP